VLCIWHPNMKLHQGRIDQLTINWIFTMFSLIIDYRIDDGICSAFIMIIINLIIDKSRLCYKITIKYWQNILYSQLYSNKTLIKTSTKKNPHILCTLIFQRPKKKRRKLREQIQYSLLIFKFYILIEENNVQIFELKFFSYRFQVLGILCNTEESSWNLVEVLYNVSDISLCILLCIFQFWNFLKYGVVCKGLFYGCFYSMMTFSQSWSMPHNIE
jgi:hypothetical protein